ncbi:MAG: formyltetrahydrofolate deformylase [Chloroflexi bacterium]|nr:formyltetrahydrofolate deformylase [Chloroflexota bacterium]
MAPGVSCLSAVSRARAAAQGRPSSAFHRERSARLGTVARLTCCCTSALLRCAVLTSSRPVNSAVLLISCPDQRGIVAAVSGFIARHHGNILESAQHTEVEDRIFLMRVEFDLEGFTLPRAEIGPSFAPLAQEFGMDWRLHFSDARKRMAIMVSREDHCLTDLLWRWRSGEIAVEIPLILSNHPDTRPIAAAAGIPFHVFPISAENRAQQEERELALLAEHRVDFIVLARYMQVLSPRFVAEWRHRVINIHHGFLPAFAGARPYQQAHRRGVKVIGATSHYVTEELDSGPIICQDMVHVGHRDSVKDLVRKGRDVERVVLARAVRAHVEDRILVYQHRTAVFA